MKQYSHRFASLLLFSSLLLPSMAQAHTGTGMLHGFGAGLFHPFSGVDHLAAMIAVGLWAAQLGGRAVWLVPSSFMLVLAGSGLLGMQFAQMPWIESGIVVSLLVFGLLIAAAVRLPVLASAVLVAVFAVFHGYAHGAEIPQHAEFLNYAAGFVLASASLHLLGIGIAQLSSGQDRLQWPRFAGVAVFLCGIISWSAA